MACYDSTENNIELQTWHLVVQQTFTKELNFKVTHLSLVYFRQNTKQSFHIPHKQYLNI